MYCGWRCFLWCRPHCCSACSITNGSASWWLATVPLLFASEELGLIDERIPSVGSAMGQWLLIMLAINAVLMLGLGLYILRRMANPQLALTRAH